ncbi:hypothetical protein DICSQDRAFT_132845, partial [Dichomitus squalens LYAD-421 SS1]|uniref:uncharacterized protein n=1 Tax=Dichomitus squalens (strain LYAD-421) TaxID=732165 RepID=UPI0004415597
AAGIALPLPIPITSGLSAVTSGSINPSSIVLKVFVPPPGLVPLHPPPPVRYSCSR